MQRLTKIWHVGTFTVLTLCAAFGVVRSEEPHSGYVLTDPTYFAGAGPATAQADSWTSAPSNQLVSAEAADLDMKTLAEEVAELKAWKEKVLAKEAADKKAASGKLSVKAGGRIMVDFANFDEDPGFPDYENGTEFRTVRIFLSGSGFDVIDYELQMDFAGQTSFKDVYLTIKELPLLQHVRIGHFKEPFSLEELTSNRYITFMERSSPNLFAPARNTGIMAFGHPGENENMTFAIGGFYGEIGDKPPIFTRDSGGGAVTMRYTFLPWYDEATNGRGLLHTGIAYSYRDFSEDTVRYRQRPEAHLAGRPVDTGVIAADSTNLFGAELAFVYGPFSAQSEYLVSYTQNPHQTFQGAYVYVSYFLTGENRAYQRSSGAFDRVKPFENFFRVRTCDGNVAMGKGAWEIAYRYSHLDLEDTVLGGRMNNHTIGLNWYLNSHTRIMWNYVRSNVDNSLAVAGIPGAGLNVFEMRAQIDF